MTSNQIAYAAAREEYRHNLENETELNRHNVKLESLQEQANRINKARIVVDAVGTVASTVSGLGTLGKGVADTILRSKEIKNAKDIADTANAIKALESDRNWNINLIRAMNEQMSVQNTYNLGLMRNFNEMRSLDETIRANQVKEAQNVMQLSNTYNIEAAKAKNQAQQISNQLYIDKLNNLNTLDTLNIKREELQLKQQELMLEQQKIQQDKEIANKQIEASKRNTRTQTGGRVLGNIIAGAATILRLVSGL